MNFRTPVSLSPAGFPVDYSTRGLFVGSCFADSVAGRMARLKFPVESNPCGVVYNPASVAGTLDRLHEGSGFSAEELTANGELWVSFSHHGSFASSDPAEALRRMNEAAACGSEALARASYVVITLGTAWVYEHMASGRIVSNCHKFPAADFRRFRLSAAEIVSLFTEPLSTYLSGKKVIFTVSPIRHIRDGLAENQLSKATLLLAVDELTRRFANCHYFPAYEIMMDDLRDYRFYEADMIHPSPVAVDYIWEQFAGWVIPPPVRELMAQVEKLVTAAEHRPFNPESAAHRKFRAEMACQTARLQAQHPGLDLHAEQDYFSR